MVSVVARRYAYYIVIVEIKNFVARIDCETFLAITAAAILLDTC